MRKHLDALIAQYERGLAAGRLTLLDLEEQADQLRRQLDGTLGALEALRNLLATLPDATDQTESE